MYMYMMCAMSWLCTGRFGCRCRYVDVDIVGGNTANVGPNMSVDVIAYMLMHMLT